VTVSIGKFWIMCSFWIEYWSNYSIRFETSNIRTTTFWYTTFYPICSVYVHRKICDVVYVGQIGLNVDVQLPKLTVVKRLQNAATKRTCILTAHQRKLAYFAVRGHIWLVSKYINIHECCVHYGSIVDLIMIDVMYTDVVMQAYLM